MFFGCLFYYQHKHLWSPWGHVSIYQTPLKFWILILEILHGQFLWLECSRSSEIFSIPELWRGNLHSAVNPTALLPSWLWATAHTVPFPVKVRAWKGKQASKSFFQRVASYRSWKWQYPNFIFVLFSVFFKFCLLIIIVFYLRCKIQWRPSLTSMTLLFF